MKENYVKQLRQLLEAEVDQAESLIAARSFSQEMQSMVEKLGRLMNEDLPAVSEQMRNSFGPDVATGFENQTTTVLQSVMDNLRDGKQQIDNSVAEISGGGTPTGAIDMESPEVNTDDEEGDLDLDLDLDLDTDSAELDVEEPDPDEEPLGRTKKESVQNIKTKIQEMAKLVKKAKTLKHKKLKEQAGKEIDYSTLEVDDINHRDAPDFTDAYFSYGEYTDGTQLTDDELNRLSDDRELVLKHVNKKYH